MVGSSKWKAPQDVTVYACPRAVGAPAAMGAVTGLVLVPVRAVMPKPVAGLRRMYILPLWVRCWLGLTEFR